MDAAPSIAGALTEFADKEFPDADGQVSCFEPQIRAKAPVDVLNTLPDHNGAASTAAGPDEDADGGAEHAAVWIPDSSLWLQRAQDNDVPVPEHGPSLATSPVVLASTADEAESAPSPDTALNWDHVLGEETVSGAREPSMSATTMIATMGIDHHEWPEAKRTRILQTMSKSSIAPATTRSTGYLAARVPRQSPRFPRPSNRYWPRIAATRPSATPLWLPTPRCPRPGWTIQQCCPTSRMRRPVPIVFIGLGTDVDPDELREIADVTGGDVFLSPEITDLEEVFFDSLSTLACDTPDC